ncbi:MAG: GAF domain-containing SpoIIE family protein phosphatase [Treponemataceae bacterium]
MKDFMNQATDSFAQNNDLNSFFDFVNNTLIRETTADGGAILLVDDLENLISVKVFAGQFPPPYRLPSDLPLRPARVESFFRFAKFSNNENIFGKIISQNKAELITNPLADNRIFQNGEDAFLKCGTYIFIPIQNEEIPIGVIALARSATTSPFSEENFKSAKIFASLVNATLKNIYLFNKLVEKAEVNREFELACIRRDSLKHQFLEDFKTFSIGHIFNPAHNICSDYYEPIFNKMNRIIFMCIDTKTNGLASLELIITIRSLIHLISNSSQNSRTMLEWINKTICSKYFQKVKTSLSIIIFNPETNEIQCSSAGDIPIYVISKNKTVCLTKKTNMLGIDKNSQYILVEQQLKKEEIICMFTDGILKTVNSPSKMYTETTLLTNIIDKKLSTAQQIANKAKLKIKAIEGNTPHYDEQTLFILKSTAQPNLAPR